MPQKGEKMMIRKGIDLENCIMADDVRKAKEKIKIGDKIKVTEKEKEDNNQVKEIKRTYIVRAKYPNFVRAERPGIHTTIHKDILYSDLAIINKRRRKQCM